MKQQRDMSALLVSCGVTCLCSGKIVAWTCVPLFTPFLDGYREAFNIPRENVYLNIN